jgi:hypothetical protein
MHQGAVVAGGEVGVKVGVLIDRGRAVRMFNRSVLPVNAPSALVDSLMAPWPCLAPKARTRAKRVTKPVSQSAPRKDQVLVLGVGAGPLPLDRGLMPMPQGQ